MFAVVGLGNPGARYAETRHNVGFRVVQYLAESSSKSRASEQWKKKFNCCFVRSRVGGTESLLVLPQKYMNLSGEACVPLISYFGITRKELIVVHDDLDLEPGTLRCKLGGSAGGHRGVEDIAYQLGRDDFYRIRVGIGHPKRELNNRELGEQSLLNAETDQRDSVETEQDVTDWVLGCPGPKEKELLEKAVPLAAEAVELLIAEGLEVAQRKFNRRSRS